MAFNLNEEWHQCGCGILFLAELGKHLEKSHPTRDGKYLCKQKDIKIVMRPLTREELRANEDELKLREAVRTSRQETRQTNKARRQESNWDGVRATRARISKRGNGGSPGLGKRR